MPNDQKTQGKNIIFTNSSILARLLFGYFIPFVLFAGVSIYTLYQLNIIGMATRDIIIVDNYIFDISKKIRDEILVSFQYQKKYVLIKDSSLLTKIIESNNNFKSLITEIFQKKIDRYYAFQDINNKYDSLYLLLTDEIEAVRDGIKYDEKYYNEKKEKKLNQLLEKLALLYDNSKISMDKKIEYINKSVTLSEKTILTITIASLVIFILMAIAITNSISRPLNILKKKTLEISKSNFDVHFDISSPPEIAQLACSFRSMCFQLKNIDKMKNDFFALMSHELRTPLTSIKEGTNLLLEGAGGDITVKQNQILIIIKEESNRLIGLVSSVLELSKMEAGMMSYSFSSANVTPLIAKAIVEISPLAESKRIEIEKNLSELPLVDIDSEKVLQVLRNLIGNAVKFSPSDSKISISTSAVPDGIEVSVTDSGPGIDPEHTDKIFDKFQQALSSSHKSLGTGLGLAIAKQIILAHEGKIWVQSETGQGSSFFFSLPSRSTPAS